MAMAVSIKIPKRCAVQLLLCQEEAEFLRIVLGTYMSSERSNGKWSRIHEDLYKTMVNIIPEINYEIEIRGALVVDN